MKTLGRLIINSEKILKNEELKMLNGGYDCHCWCYDFVVCKGIIAADNQTDCFDACHLVNAGWDGTWNCFG